MENSKIEWTDHTWNPWIGCTKVSPGCQHCYAEALMDGRFGRVQWGPQGTRVRTSAANWRKPLQWNKRAEEEGVRYRVFCASLADVFERKGSQRKEMAEWRHDLFAMIEQTPNLDWLLLTKRPENVNDMIFQEWQTFLPSNVWIGTSVENQEQADKRIPELLSIPAAVRFLSVEPLLGPVSIAEYYQEEGKGTYSLWIDYLDWVIVGGESGPNARPMHPDWVRSIRDQCQAADVPFLFKQWGEFAPALSTDHPINLGGSEYVWTPDKNDGYLMNRIGKHAAGRLLDGQEWNGYPVRMQESQRTEP